MNIEKLIKVNQDNIKETEDKISDIDKQIKNIEIEIRGIKQDTDIAIKKIEKEADKKIKQLNYKKLNFLYDKELLIKRLLDIQQKIEDLKGQI
jgi:chromosome segregation ATPase